MPARPYTPPNSCIKYRSLDVCIIEYRSLKVFHNLGCCLLLWSTWHWGRWGWWWWWWWQGGGGVENGGCIKYRLPDCWRHEADPRDISIESLDEENQKYNSISSEIELSSLATNFVSFSLLCNQRSTLEMESKFSLHTLRRCPVISIVNSLLTKFPSSS